MEQNENLIEDNEEPKALNASEPTKPTEASEITEATVITDPTEATETIVEIAEPDGVKKKKSKSFWRDLAETLILAVALFMILNTITARVKVFNVSMQPTLKQGHLLLVNKLAYKLGEPQYGDVVIFHYNGKQDDDYIKRVVGLPGDLVQISGGVVRINGNAITEPYIAEVPNYSGEWQVPEDELFVLGDNRNNSSDSHQWGTVKMEWVVGKAVLIYYPFNEARMLSVDNLVHALPEAE